MNNIMKIPELGQVWTPDNIALQMVKHLFVYHPYCKKILDPSCGPGTFLKALIDSASVNFELTCYDVDQRMINLTENIEVPKNSKKVVLNADYLLDQNLQNSFDAVIMNPPYIRQEEIESIKKKKYYKYIEKEFNETIDKRSNLFVLFLLKGILDLKTDGVLVAIVYDAINQTRYGQRMMNTINKHAEILLSHHVEAPFESTMIDARIIIFKKRSEAIHLEQEEILYKNCGHVKLEDLLYIKRGTAFPVRSAFIANEKDPCFQEAIPIMFKASNPKSLIVKADKNAYAVINGSDTLSANATAQINEKLIKLNKKQITPKVRVVSGQIAFNYYIRDSARHLWNKDNIAISDNFYISSTKDSFPCEVAWLLLNSSAYINPILASGRNQGSGLLKLQVYEYKNGYVPDWRQIDQRIIKKLHKKAKDLISSQANIEEVRKVADTLTKGLFN